jgi:hypothetical protein
MEEQMTDTALDNHVLARFARWGAKPPTGSVAEASRWQGFAHELRDALVEAIEINTAVIAQADAWRDRVRALHAEGNLPHPYNEEWRSFCRECGKSFPCPTLLAMEGPA